MKTDQHFDHPLMDHLSYQLRRTAVLIQRDLSQRLKPLGINLVEMSTLLIIDARPSISPAKIGRIINVERANMASITSRLSSRNLIRTEPVDGRSIGLYLSKTGNDMIALIQQCIELNEDTLFQKIPADTREQLVYWIGKI